MVSKTLSRATTGVIGRWKKGNNGGVWEWLPPSFDKVDGFIPSKIISRGIIHYPGLTLDSLTFRVQVFYGLFRWEASSVVSVVL